MRRQFLMSAIAFGITCFGMNSISTSAMGTSVVMEQDDVVVPMNKVELGKWSSEVQHGVWEPNETVDRYEFHVGEEGLAGGVSFNLQRSWEWTLDNTKLEDTLYAELKDGSFIPVFFDPGSDDATTTQGGVSLSRNDEVVKNGGLAQLTGNFIFETKRVSNIDKQYTYDISFTFTENGNVIRFGGKDRYEVEKNLNAAIPDHSMDAVIVTSGLKYSDALVGSVLNKKLNAATILINDEDALIQDKISEAERLLKPGGKIYILGGTGTVSTKVETEFKKHLTVGRIDGKDRLEVALKVAEIVNPSPVELFLAYGLVFSDSLSITPEATERQTPILTQWGTHLKPEIKDYIIKHPTIKKVYIVSGTGVIPVSIEDELRQLGVTSVERLAGKDRYETSLAIAKKFYASPVSAAFANGLEFADALSGARHAWINNSPILLAKKEGIPVNTWLYSINLRRAWLLGGTATLPDQIVDQLKQ